MTNFKGFGCNVDIYDPYVSVEEVKKLYSIDLVSEPKRGAYDAIVIAVAHDKFREYSLKTLQDLAKESYILFDAKYVLNKKNVDGRL